MRLADAATVTSILRLFDGREDIMCFVFDRLLWLPGVGE